MWDLLYKSLVIDQRNRRNVDEALIHPCINRSYDSSEINSVSYVIQRKIYVFVHATNLSYSH